ncbi:MAG TPA: helix-turn-helix transcriptional regulator [Bacteriovoracaceae bacterium]|nr:helix-turn-helix transcriptional regulator [Bacteriovoracaceae bacterium]
MNEQIYSIGPIMKAARKFKKLNQADVAQAIGCSQSALSKMEHNLLVPSAPQWFLFSRFTAIPPETLETGIIDRHLAVKFNNADVSLGFKIPKRYRQFRALKMREIYPFIQVLEKDSPDGLKEFITQTGLDPEFFLDFDNLVNFHLIADVMNYFIQHGKGNPTDIKHIVEFGQNEVYWDHCNVEWKKLQNIQQVLTEFVKEQLFFQTDFQLKVEGGGERITLSYFPEYHLKQMGTIYTQELQQFLNVYRKYTIENVLKQVLEKNVTAELVQETQGASPLGARFEVRAA